jgi:hypothetical protein
MAWWGSDEPEEEVYDEVEAKRRMYAAAGYVRPPRAFRTEYNAKFGAGPDEEVYDEEEAKRRSRMYSQAEVARINEEEETEPGFISKALARMIPGGTMFSGASDELARDISRGGRSVSAATAGGFAPFARLAQLQSEIVPVTPHVSQGLGELADDLKAASSEGNINALYAKSEDSMVNRVAGNLGTGIYSSLPGMAIGAGAGLVAGPWAASATEALSEGVSTFEESEANYLAQGMDPGEARLKAAMQGAKGAALNMTLLRMTDKFGLDDDLVKQMLGKGEVGGVFRYMKGKIPDAVLMPALVSWKAITEGFEERAQSAISGVLGNNLDLTGANLASQFNTPQAQEEGYIGAIIGGIGAGPTYSAMRTQAAAGQGATGEATPDIGAMMDQATSFAQGQPTLPYAGAGMETLAAAPEPAALSMGDYGENWREVTPEETQTLRESREAEDVFQEDKEDRAWNQEQRRQAYENDQVAQAQREKVQDDFWAPVVERYGPEKAQAYDTMIRHFVAASMPETATPAHLEDAYYDLLSNITNQNIPAEQLLNMIGDNADTSRPAGFVDEAAEQRAQEKALTNAAANALPTELGDIGPASKTLGATMDDIEKGLAPPKPPRATATPKTDPMAVAAKTEMAIREAVKPDTAPVKTAPPRGFKPIQERVPAWKLMAVKATPSLAKLYATVAEYYGKLDDKSLLGSSTYDLAKSMKLAPPTGAGKSRITTGQLELQLSIIRSEEIARRGLAQEKAPGILLQGAKPLREGVDPEAEPQLAEVNQMHHRLSRVVVNATNGRNGLSNYNGTAQPSREVNPGDGSRVRVFNRPGSNRGVLYQAVSPGDRGFTNLAFDQDTGNLYLGMTENKNRNDRGLSWKRLVAAVRQVVFEHPEALDGKIYGEVVGGLPAARSRLKWEGTTSVLPNDNGIYGSSSVIMATPVSSIMQNKMVAPDEEVLRELYPEEFNDEPNPEGDITFLQSRKGDSGEGQKNGANPQAKAGAKGPGPKPKRGRGAGRPGVRAEVEPPRGAIKIDPDTGQAIIYLTEHADESTFLHELWHYFETRLSPANRALLDKAIALEEKRRGSSMDQIQRAEFFAESAEEYFKSGRAPVPTLKSTFAKFREWLSGVYAYLNGRRLTAKNRHMLKVLQNALTPGKNFAEELYVNEKPTVPTGDRMLLQGGHKTIGQRIDDIIGAIKQKHVSTEGGRSLADAMELVETVTAPTDKRGYFAPSNWLLKWPRFVDVYSQRYPSLAVFNRATRSMFERVKEVMGMANPLMKSWQSLSPREQAAVSVSMNVWSRMEVKDEKGNVIGVGMNFNTPEGLKSLKDRMKWNDRMVAHYKERMDYYQKSAEHLTGMAERLMVDEVEKILSKSALDEALKNALRKKARSAFKKLKAKLSENKAYVPFIRFGDHEANIYTPGSDQPVAVIRYFSQEDYRDQLQMIAKANKLDLASLTSRDPAAVVEVSWDNGKSIQKLGSVRALTEDAMKAAVLNKLVESGVWDGKGVPPGKVITRTLAEAGRETAMKLSRGAHEFSGYDVNFLDAISDIVDTVIPDENARNEYLQNAFPGMVSDEIKSFLAQNAQNAAHRSFSGRLKHRSGMLGFSNQGQMVDAHYARAIARETGIREHYGNVAKAMAQVATEAKGTNIPQVADKYWEYLMHPPNAIESAVTAAKGFTAMWRLGWKFLYSVPQQHFQRYSQEWPLFKVLYAPSFADGSLSKRALADIHDAAGRAAYRQLATDFKNNLAGEPSSMLTPSGDLAPALREAIEKLVKQHKLGDPKAVASALAKAIKTAEDQGTFNNQLTEDVVEALIDNRFVTSKMSKVYRKAVELSGGLSSPMESANRRRTFITDFVVGFTTGHSDGEVRGDSIGNWKKATAYAQEQVDRIHNQQGRAARPGLERAHGAVLLGPMLQFKSFQIDYAAAFLTAAYKARKQLIADGMDPKQATREAYTPVIQGWAVTAALAGVKGSAYLGVSMAILGYMLGKLLGDEWTDWEEVARRALMHHLGEKLGRSVMDGGFNLIGLDIGSSFNMSDFFFIKPNASYGEAALQVVGGAFGGTVIDFAEGATGKNNKDYKNMMPDAAKAVARASEGVFHANKQKQTYTPTQRALKALGITTSAETKEYMLAGISQNIKDSSTKIMKEFGEELAGRTQDLRNAKTEREAAAIRKDMDDIKKKYLAKAKDFNEYLKLVGAFESHKLDSPKLDRKVKTLLEEGTPKGKTKQELDKMRKSWGM